MEGHGAFVWSAYLITLGAIVLILYAPKRREKRFLRQLEGQIRRSGGNAPGAAKEV
ncbi:MAG: heme exporter protein CcmD [Haliea sp.]|uniref:heme exporter protein CcmD n=1 Tax=Haliea sp. TaxID=1932666 RepID=UPI0032EDA0DF